MKLLPEIYHSIPEMIEGTLPEARLGRHWYSGFPGHGIEWRIPEYMGEACFCINADVYDALTYTESTS